MDKIENLSLIMPILKIQSEKSPENKNGGCSGEFLDMKPISTRKILRNSCPVEIAEQSGISSKIDVINLDGMEEDRTNAALEPDLPPAPSPLELLSILSELQQPEKEESEQGKDDENQEDIGVFCSEKIRQLSDESAAVLETLRKEQEIFVAKMQEREKLLELHLNSVKDSIDIHKSMEAEQEEKKKKLQQRLESRAEEIEHQVFNSKNTTPSEAEPSTAYERSEGELKTSCTAPAKAHKKQGTDFPPVQMCNQLGPPGTASSLPEVTNKPAEGLTLMEQMMLAQQAAKKEIVEKKSSKEKRLKTEFGAGLKKGFFNSSKEKKVKVKTVPSSARSSESIETVKPKQPAAKYEKSTLVIPEVQDALKNRSAKADQSASAWMTPELLQKIGSRPELVRAMVDPKFSRLLEEMVKDPKATYKKIEGNEEAQNILRGFTEILGEHFEQIGASKEEDLPLPQGPLAERALKAHSDGTAASMLPDTDEEQEKVNKILADPELREILMDASMQTILVECGNPIKLEAYLKDPVISPKIVKLADAGLVQVVK